jgi:hypothetical protein
MGSTLAMLLGVHANVLVVKWADAGLRLDPVVLRYKEPSASTTNANPTSHCRERRPREEESWESRQCELPPIIITASYLINNRWR